MEKRVLCEEAEERGRIEGERLGERRGRIEGIQLGIVNGIISTLSDLDYSYEDIISVLQKKLHITESQADKYLEQYYSNNL
jgi:predicted transposase YdaD